MATARCARVHSAACRSCTSCRWLFLHITARVSQDDAVENPPGSREISLCLLLLLNNLFCWQGVLLLPLSLLQLGLNKKLLISPMSGLSNIFLKQSEKFRFQSAAPGLPLLLLQQKTKRNPFLNVYREGEKMHQ